MHARLAAASDDYRQLQRQIGSARSALLVASLVYLTITVVGLLAVHSAERAFGGSAFSLDFLVNLLIAGVFLCLWWLARSAPALAMLLAALLWVGLQGLVALASPLAVLSGGIWIVWIKLVVAILVIRGIVTGVKAASFLRKLRHPTPGVTT